MIEKSNNSNVFYYQDILLYIYQTSYNVINFVKELFTIFSFISSNKISEIKNSNNNLDDIFKIKNKGTICNHDCNCNIHNKNIVINIYNYYYENDNKKNRSDNNLIDNNLINNNLIDNNLIDNVIIKSPIHNKMQNSFNNTGSFREPNCLRVTKKKIKHNEIFLTEDKKWGWFIDIENNIG